MRLFIDGRRDVGKSNVVLATVKIEGHAGTRVEISVAIIETKEDRGALDCVGLAEAFLVVALPHVSLSHFSQSGSVLHHLRGLVEQFLALEESGLELYGVNVPVHSVFVFDGKMYTLALGKRFRCGYLRHTAAHTHLFYSLTSNLKVLRPPLFL